MQIRSRAAVQYVQCNMQRYEKRGVFFERKGTKQRKKTTGFFFHSVRGAVSVSIATQL